MTVLAPCDARELRRMLWWTRGEHGPVTIRYARDGSDVEGRKNREFRPGKWETLIEWKDCAILAVGTMVKVALKTAGMLAERGIEAGVINCSSLKPLDEECLRSLQGTPVFTMEEHMKAGGFGTYLTQRCLEMGLEPPRKVFAVEDCFPQHGRHSLLMQDMGLDPQSLSERILACMQA